MREVWTVCRSFRNEEGAPAAAVLQVSDQFYFALNNEEGTEAREFIQDSAIHTFAGMGFDCSGNWKLEPVEDPILREPVGHFYLVRAESSDVVV